MNNDVCGHELFFIHPSAGMSLVTDSIGKDLYAINSIDLDVLTSRIRVYMKSAMGTGILELEVTGIDLGPCDPSKVDEYIMINDEEIKQDKTAIIM